MTFGVSEIPVGHDVQLLSVDDLSIVANSMEIVVNDGDNKGLSDWVTFDLCDGQNGERVKE